MIIMTKNKAINLLRKPTECCGCSQDGPLRIRDSMYPPLFIVGYFPLSNWCFRGGRNRCHTLRLCVEGYLVCTLHKKLSV